MKKYNLTDLRIEDMDTNNEAISGFEFKYHYELKELERYLNEDDTSNDFKLHKLNEIEVLVSVAYHMNIIEFKRYNVYMDKLTRIYLDLW